MLEMIDLREYGEYGRWCFRVTMEWKCNLQCDVGKKSVIDDEFALELGWWAIWMEHILHQMRTLSLCRYKMEKSLKDDEWCWMNRDHELDVDEDEISRLIACTSFDVVSISNSSKQRSFTHSTKQPSSYHLRDRFFICLILNQKNLLVVNYVKDYRFQQADFRYMS